MANRWKMASPRKRAETVELLGRGSIYWAGRKKANSL